jgi:hypothetical protein
VPAITLPATEQTLAESQDSAKSPDAITRQLSDRPSYRYTDGRVIYSLCSHVRLVVEPSGEIRVVTAPGRAVTS